MTWRNVSNELGSMLRARPLWALAFLATLLLPIMLIFARAGIEICGAIIGISFLYHSWRSCDWAWLRTPFFLTALAVWGWLVLVVTPLAIKPEVSIIESAAWIRLPLMMAALRYWVLASALARRVLAIWLAGILALVAVDTLWQLVTGTSLTGQARLATGRLTGPFDNPKVGIFIAKIFLPVLAIGLGFAMAEQRTRAMLAWAGLTLVLLATVLLSGERAAFVGMTLALATATGLLMLYEKRLRIPALLAGMSLAISLVGAYFAVAWVQLRADHLFASLANYGASDYGQLAKAGIAIGMEHPLVGAGVNSFRDLCPELPYQGTMFRGLHPHNIFIEWFAAAGVPGLMLLIVLIGQWVHEAATRLRGVSNAERLISACAIGVVLQHFFPLLGMQSSFANWSAMLTWYPLALMMAALPPRARIR